MTPAEKVVRPNWFDWIVYRLFYWRWNRILKNRQDLRWLLQMHLKHFDELGDLHERKPDGGNGNE